MTTAAFSSDGSVLAVAADKVITLWEPDRNTLLAVIGDTLEVSHILIVSNARLHTSWICPDDTYSYLVLLLILSRSNLYVFCV